MTWRLLRDLWYPTDPAVVQSLTNGDNPPLRSRGMRHITAGEVVGDIPAASVPVLLAKGWIEPVTLTPKGAKHDKAE